jgi:hypothetical protein
MATNLLTDAAIRAALKRATEAGATIKVNDGDGLRLDCQPSGAGWWRLRYRFAGREGMLSLGVYPEVALALARARRDDARKLIAAGTNPAAARKAEKAERARQAEAAEVEAAGLPPEGSFEAVAREWLQVKHAAEGRCPARC